MRKKLAAVAMAVSLAVGCLSGCATPGGSEKNGSSAASQADPGGSESKEGQTAQAAGGEVTITYAQTKDVDSLDPRNATSAITAAMIAQIFSTLVATDEDYIIPLYQPHLICAYNKEKISKWVPRADEMLILSHVKIAK